VGLPEWAGHLSFLVAGNEGCWRRSDHMGMWEEARAEAEGSVRGFMRAQEKACFRS